MTTVETTVAIPMYMSALERAQEVRLDRVRIKREVAAGARDVRMVLEDPPPSCRGAAVYKVVQWVPRIGPMKARQLLASVLPGGIPSETLKVEALSPRTRSELIRRVSDYCTTGGER